MDDRVCRRCRFYFEEGRYIDVQPPRASRRRSRLNLRIPRWSVYAAAAVPGLAHVVLGQRRRGLCFLVAYIVLMSMGVIFFADFLGQILFGIALSVHAYSILDLTAWKRTESVVVRSFSMLGVVLILFMVFWPIMDHLALVLVYPNEGSGARTFGGFGGIGLGQIVAIGVLFVISIFASLWLRRTLTRNSP
jgi:hypothetical protein